MHNAPEPAATDEAEEPHPLSDPGLPPLETEEQRNAFDGEQRRGWYARSS